MEYNLFASLYKKFIENDFLLINGFYDKKEIDNESKFVVVYKTVGNYTYCVALINAKSSYVNYEDLINYIKQQSDEIFIRFNIEKVIFLNIVIMEYISDCDKLFLEKFNFDSEKERNDLCWILEENKKQIFSGTKQPSMILNLHKIIQGAFSDEEKEMGTDFQNIYENVQIKKTKELKSNDNLVTFILIIINVFVFSLMELNGGSENINNLIAFGASVPERIYANNEFFRFFTSMFVHIGYAHIMSNCLSLYILGSRGEKHFGKSLFIIIYILSGIGASLVSFIFAAPNSISAGASGAIFGIMGAMLVHSLSNDESIGGFSGYFMILFSLINMSAGFFMPGVDNAGHIGGFITGIIVIFIYNMGKNLKNKF